MSNKRNSIILLLSFYLIINLSTLSCKQSDKEIDSTQKISKSNLVGDWIRTDAGYRINIVKINDDGTLVAQYFNPQPINVGNAIWEESYGNLKLTIELRDVNYPGSTYRLSYLHDKDMLAGEYYQAVEGLTFYVEFMRSK